jgi:4-amino-4-deoxy-L-arabinose transferase-like glycosyltransferase
LKNKTLLPFCLLTASAFVILILPNLLQDGMFTDGVLYAAVAKNLSQGRGTFWFPHFSETMFSPFFHQQPPLTFGIQALFFKALGTSIYTERFYSFLTACITGWVLAALWKEIEKHNKEIQNLSWFAVFTWISIPVCFWSYSNNMEENTMGVFTAWSVLLIYRGLNRTDSSVFGYLIAGACAAVLASLCKGFPGLFPLAIPFLFWLVFRSYSLTRMLLYSALVTGLSLLIYAFILQNSNACKSLTAYVNGRVLNSIRNVATEEYRLYLIKRLLMELSSPALLIALLLFIFRRNNIRMNWSNRIWYKSILFFLLIGLSASLPLLVTLEQRRFYLVPAIPYFSIALCLIAAPGLSLCLAKIRTESKGFRLFTAFAVVFLLGGLLFSALQVGKTVRDKDDLDDLYVLGAAIPPGTVVNVYSKTWDNWALHNYFTRYFNISLASDQRNFDFFIAEKSLGQVPPAPYRKIPLPTHKYDLYQLQKTIPAPGN